MWLNTSNCHHRDKLKFGFREASQRGLGREGISSAQVPRGWQAEPTWCEYEDTGPRKATLSFFIVLFVVLVAVPI